MNKSAGILFAIVVVSGVFSEISYRAIWLQGECIGGLVFALSLGLLVLCLLGLLVGGAYRLVKKGVTRG